MPRRGSGWRRILFVLLADKRTYTSTPQETGPTNALSELLALGRITCMQLPEVDRHGLALSSRVLKRNEAMPTVDFIYDRDCPNAAGARAQLLHAFAEAQIPPRWQEWCGDDPELPHRVRGYGSPTILVDGEDVARVERSDAACCRLYPQPDGSVRGVPSVEMITNALVPRGTPVAPASRSWG